MSALAAAAREARSLGILGGSFDPPHRGHLHVARSARAACGIDHVLFVPAAHPPHKPERTLAPGAERVRMLELLLEDEPACSIWTGELERSGPSYTIDTVRELAAELGPDVRLFLLIGSDNLADLAGWHEADELLHLVTPVIVVRRGSPLELDAFPEAVRPRVRLVEVEPVEAAATELRARLARGEDVGDALPPRLAEYVRARGLYARR